MKRSKVWLGLGSGVAALVIGVSSAAWSCSPSRSVCVQEPGATGDCSSSQTPMAEPGALVNVVGTAFYAGRFEIRWGGPTGNLATNPFTGGGSFNKAVRIPELAPGRHTLFVIGPDPDGQTTGNTTAAAAIEVTTDTNPTARPVDQEANAGPEPGTTSPTASPDTAPTGSSEPTSSAPAPTASSDTPSAAPMSTAAATPGSPVGNRSGSVTGPLAAGRDRTTAAGGSAPATPQAAVPVPAAGLDETAAARPSVRSVGDDLWDGVQASEPSRGPSLHDQPAAVSRSNLPLTIGITLLSVGLVVLLGRFALAESGRRRARASS